MYVNPSKQIFKCFACGVGGDVLRFVQMREGLTFPQTIERLAERAGIQLQRVKGNQPQTQNAVEVDPNMLAKANAWAALRRHLWSQRIKTMFGESLGHNKNLAVLIEALSKAA